DKVLYFEAAKDKTYSGKLDQKWKGSYYIYQLLLNGSYKIRELDSHVFCTPVNGDLLK
ncbi:9286_t:CDS:1, partial [Funneliformis geosporum]